MIVAIDWLRDFCRFEGGGDFVRDGLEAVGIKWLRADDRVIEIQDHPRRPDLMGHLGVARELAAWSAGDIAEPARGESPGEETPPGEIELQILDEEIASRLSAVIVSGIEAGPGLDLIRERLGLMGLAPADPVTDVIRYVTLATGHPVLAVDRSKISGGRLVVRRAQASESIRVPGKGEVSLSGDVAVFADERAPLGLAGIQIGADASVSDQTREVILVSGVFDPGLVEKTRKRLDLRTLASDRFEKGCDKSMPLYVLKTAAELLRGGSGIGMIDLLIRPFKPRVVVLRKTRLAELLGTEIKKDFVERVLTVQGFQLDSQAPGSWKVKVPSFRPDIERETDLIEEVVRFYGVERMSPSIPVRPLTAGGTDQVRRLMFEMRRLLFHQGFDEAVNPAFSDPEKEVWFGNERYAIEIRNPDELHNALLRTNLLGGLLRNLTLNLERGADGAHLFEIGRIFLRGEKSPSERSTLGLASSGWLGVPHWLGERRRSDFFFLKGTCEGFLEYLGFEAVAFREENFPFLEKDRSLAISVKGETLGWIGRVCAEICQAYGLDGDVWGAQIDLSALLDKHPRAYRGYAADAHPEVRVELTFEAGPDRRFQEIEEAIDRLSLPGLNGWTLLHRVPAAESEQGIRYTISFRFRKEKTGGSGRPKGARIDKIVKHLKNDVGIQNIKGGQN